MLKLNKPRSKTRGPICVDNKKKTTKPLPKKPGGTTNYRAPVERRIDELAAGWGKARVEVTEDEV